MRQNTALAPAAQKAPHLLDLPPALGGEKPSTGSLVEIVKQVNALKFWPFFLG
jgi:hypothetical protein